MPIAVEVVTQEKLIFSESEADMVLVPATEGEMGVLPNHAPVLTTLGYGELIIRKGRASERFAIYGGVVDIRPDKVVVLADIAASSYALDEAEAEAARERAKKQLESAQSDAEFQHAVHELRRAEFTIRINRKVRATGPSIRILDEDENENS